MHLCLPCDLLCSLGRAKRSLLFKDDFVAFQASFLVLEGIRSGLGCVDVIARNLAICLLDQGLILCPREEVASIISLQRAPPIEPMILFFGAAHCQLGPFPMKTQWRCSHHLVDLWCDLSTRHVLTGILRDHLWCHLSTVCGGHDFPRSLAR